MIPLRLPRYVHAWTARAEVRKKLVRITYCAWSVYKLEFYLNEDDVDLLIRDLQRAKEKLAARRGTP